MGKTRHLLQDLANALLRFIQLSSLVQHSSQFEQCLYEVGFRLQCHAQRCFCLLKPA